MYLKSSDYLKDISMNSYVYGNDRIEILTTSADSARESTEADSTDVDMNVNLWDVDKKNYLCESRSMYLSVPATF